MPSLIVLNEMKEKLDATYLEPDPDDEEAVSPNPATYPQHVNRASQAGHECARFLVYSRTDQEHKAPWDIETLRKFREGRVQEAEVLRLLDRAGIKVRQQQKQLWWEKLELSGHIDGEIKIDGKWLPMEVKSMGGNFYARAIAEAAERGTWSNKWLKHYLAQLTIYELLEGAEEGVFFCKSRDSGDCTPIRMPLDLAYGEELLRKLELVNLAVKEVKEARANNVDPEPFFPPKINKWSCLECQFAHICGPAPRSEDVVVDGDTYTVVDVETMMARRVALQAQVAAIKEAKAELDALNKVLGGIVQAAGGEFETPNWYIHGKVMDVKERVQKGYSYYGWWPRERAIARAGREAKAGKGKKGGKAAKGGAE